MEKGEKASAAVLLLFAFFLVSESHAPETPAPPVRIAPAPAPAQVALAGVELEVIEGHRRLTRAELDDLEALTRRLATAAEREPSARETLVGVLSREHGGLYKRALAYQALRLAGHGALADQVIARDPQADDLRRIGRQLDRASTLAQHTM